jgi:hypothetical protein
MDVDDVSDLTTHSTANQNTQFPPVDPFYYIGSPVPARDVIKFYGDGLGGWLTTGAAAINTAAALEAATLNYSEFPMPTVVLKNTGADLPAATVDALLAAWEEARSNRATAYLNSAIEAKGMGWSARDLALVEARNESAIQIARLANLDPVWVGAGLLFYLVRRENPLAVRLLDLLPAIGGYRKNQALADFSFALGNLLEAGAPIGQAWRDSGRIARSRRILAASQAIEDLIEGGLAPGPNLSKHRVFPPDFIARYQTGETAGGLEKALLLIAADYQIRANQRLAIAAKLYPSLLFSAVVIMVAYVVIGFFMNYIGTLNKLMDGG